MAISTEATKTHGGKGSRDVNGPIKKENYDRIFRKDKKQEVAKKEK